MPLSIKFQDSFKYLGLGKYVSFLTDIYYVLNILHTQSRNFLDKAYFNTFGWLWFLWIGCRMNIFCLLSVFPAYASENFELLLQLCITICRQIWSISELEFLRPTVSRPVRLGIGPPFGTLDHILSFSSFFVWQLLYSSFEDALSDEKTGL
jgi:hypothetical protein